MESSLCSALFPQGNSENVGGEGNYLLFAHIFHSDWKVKGSLSMGF